MICGVSEKKNICFKYVPVPLIITLEITIMYLLFITLSYSSLRKNNTYFLEHSDYTSGADCKWYQSVMASLKIIAEPIQLLQLPNFTCTF